MIVHNLDISCAIFDPAKYNTPLRINANAVETLEITFQWLEPISGWGAKVVQGLGAIQNIELIKREVVNLAWKFSDMAAGDAMK